VLNFKRFATLLVVLLACTGLMMAQTVQGVITGTVTDTTGAVIPGATVTITNEGTNVSQSTTSGGAGEYRFSLVPPGSYTVQVSAPNLATKTDKGIVVNPSQTVPLNVSLGAAGTSVSVDVTSAAPLVQTASSDLATTINGAEIANTPLFDRNVFNLAFSAPQVTQGMNLGISSGGQREASTTYLLNGTDNNDNFGEGGGNITPPLESVGEFTLLTNNESAQYGRGSAIVSAAQKSGTNKFHGVLYEFNRNRSLNASDFFANRNNTGKPKYIRNQFGGEVDGPIYKDKTFFSFAYDQVTLKTQATGGFDNIQVPTPSELQAMQASAAPIASYYLKTYQPLTSNTLCPNEAGTPAVGHIGCVSLFDPINAPQKNYYGRIDHNFSPFDRLALSVNVSRQPYTDLYGGGNVATTPISYLDTEHYHQITLTETHVFSPNIVNEYTVSHNRHYSHSQEGKGNGNDPQVAIDGQAYSGFGFGLGAYEGGLIVSFTQDRTSFSDALSWTVGRHSIKIGGGTNAGILYRNWDLGAPGYYEFANTLGPAPAAGPISPASDPNASTDSNFSQDYPYFEEVSINPATGGKGNGYVHYVSSDSNAFVQDDWKVNSRLTLNLGLRWDRYGAPKEVTGVMAQLVNFNCITADPVANKTCVANARTGPVKAMWNTRNKDFGPRLGFAYDVFGNGRTALRGGYGINYDRVFDNIWSNGAWNPPFYGLFDADATANDTIYYTRPASTVPTYVPGSLPGAAGRVSIRTMENNLKDTSGQNFYLGIEHQFFTNMLFRVNYQGSLGRHEPILMNYNRVDGIAYNKSLVPKRPNSLYSGFNYRALGVNSSYHALVLELQKRMSNGLQVQSSYTWSKLIDTNSELFAGSTVTGGNTQPYYYVSNQHINLEKGLGAFNHTQNWKANISYELPFLRSQQGADGHVLGGWQLNAFFQGYSGHPIEVFNGRTRRKGNALDANGIPENLGGDYNLDGVGNDHPDFVGSNFNAVYSTNSPADGIFVDNNLIGCGFSGQQSTNTAACNTVFGVGTPNALFVNPKGTGVRFGNLGRNVFHGPWFNVLDASLFKNIKMGESKQLQLRFEALNSLNHPNFDGVVSNLNSAQFGKAQFLVGAAPARRLQLGLRYSF